MRVKRAWRLVLTAAIAMVGVGCYTRADVEGWQRKAQSYKLQNEALERERDELLARLQRGQRIEAPSDDTHKYGGEMIRLPEHVLFASGKDALTAEGQRVLQGVAAQIMRDHPNMTILVEGHTDADPIRKSGWASNLHLSVARSATVANFLVSQGLDPRFVYPAGRGQNDPLSSNSTREGKSRNRRVEVIILPAGMLTTASASSP